MFLLIREEMEKKKKKKEYFPYIQTLFLSYVAFLQMALRSGYTKNTGVKWGLTLNSDRHLQAWYPCSLPAHLTAESFSILSYQQYQIPCLQCCSSICLLHLPHHCRSLHTRDLVPLCCRTAWAAVTP